MKLLWTVLLLFPFFANALYLPSRSNVEVSVSASMSHESIVSMGSDNFNYNDILVSAHLLKKAVNSKFDFVTNYHLSHGKGTVQTQLVYHLCCESADRVYLALSGGLNTDIQVHGGGGIEVIFSNLTLFVSGTHRKEFRGGFIVYFGAHNDFHVGALMDLHLNEGSIEERYYGLIFGFHLDKKGEAVIDKIQESVGNPL